MDILNRRRETIAMCCYQAWYSYAVHGLGEEGYIWSEAPEYQRESIRHAVDLWDSYIATHEDFDDDEKFINNLCAASHENWIEYKESQGWKWGPVKDVSLKTHPCMVPYDGLPESQRKKDLVVVLTYLECVDFFSNP